MGNQQTTFEEQQLEAYQDCTFFTRQDILRIFKRFKMIGTPHVPDKMDSTKCKDLRLRLEQIVSIPELKENPFRTRICEVFSRDNSGNLSFDEFLNMFSVFSEDAPRDIKAVFAFKIYDFDGDNTLNKSDLQKTLKAITQKSTTSREQTDMTDWEYIPQNQKALELEEENHILEQVLKEADLDDNNELSYIEFEHIVSRAPDFLTTFHIRI